MKVYYIIPDSDNQQQNQLLKLLYENARLHILLAVQPIEKLTEKENGMIVIERMEDSIEFRYEGWSPEVEYLIKFMIGQAVKKQKIKF